MDSEKTLSDLTAEFDAVVDQITGFQNEVEELCRQRLLFAYPEGPDTHNIRITIEKGLNLRFLPEGRGEGIRIVATTKNQGDGADETPAWTILGEVTYCFLDGKAKVQTLTTGGEGLPLQNALESLKQACAVHIALFGKKNAPASRPEVNL